jgi:hypothetical protein
MQRARRRYQIVSILLCVMLGGFVALTACSNYEEGDRCEILNGNEDCQDPLQCTPKAQINTPYNSSDRCCPVNRASATHPACTVLQNPIAGDSAPPPDTGPVPDATTGDSADTSTPIDSGSDADLDAAEGG